LPALPLAGEVRAKLPDQISMLDTIADVMRQVLDMFISG